MPDLPIDTALRQAALARLKAAGLVGGRIFSSLDESLDEEQIPALVIWSGDTRIEEAGGNSRPAPSRAQKRIHELAVSCIEQRTIDDEDFEAAEARAEELGTRVEELLMADGADALRGNVKLAAVNNVCFFDRNKADRLVIHRVLVFEIPHHTLAGQPRIRLS